MPDELGELKAAYADIDARLGGPEAQNGSRDQLKAEIIALYKRVEQRVTELTAFKDDVKKLVDKWKTAQQQAAPSVAPQFTG